MNPFDLPGINPTTREPGFTFGNARLHPVTAPSPALRHILLLLLAATFAGCATETSRTIEPTQTQAKATPLADRGPQSAVIVGKFDNRSAFMRGIFSDGVDRLGGQAKTILITHLQQTGRYAVLDRENLEEIKHEGELKGEALQLKGADFAISGDITEFGRKEMGDQQLFGIMGASKQQVAYAKVSLYVVNVATSEVMFSVQGAGEFQLSHREVLGFGGTSSYDATLNGKVLDLAIRQAVDALATGSDRGNFHATR